MESPIFKPSLLPQMVVLQLHVLPTPCITWVYGLITNMRMVIPVPGVEYRMIHTQHHLPLPPRHSTTRVLMLRVEMEARYRRICDKATS